MIHSRSNSAKAAVLPRVAAVLTGDLIASRTHKAAELTATMACLEQAARDIGADTRQETLFERHRGDGWQVFLPQGCTALRAALRLIAALAASPTTHDSAQRIASRIAIGLGSAHLPPDGALGAASGGAFIAAGDTLTSMERATRLDITQSVAPQTRAMIGLLDWQSQHWTAPQAEALFEALRAHPPTQDEIAAKFGVSRQAVQARLAGVGLGPLRTAITAFEREVRTTQGGAP